MYMEVTDQTWMLFLWQCPPIFSFFLFEAGSFTSLEFMSTEPGNATHTHTHVGPQVCVQVTFLPCFLKQKLPLSASVHVILSSQTLAFESASSSGTRNPCPLTSYADFSKTRSYLSNLLPVMRSVAVVHQARWFWGSPGVTSPPARLAASDPWWTTPEFWSALPSQLRSFPF